MKYIVNVFSFLFCCLLMASCEEDIINNSQNIDDDNFITIPLYLGTESDLSTRSHYYWTNRVNGQTSMEEIWDCFDKDGSCKAFVNETFNFNQSGHLYVYIYYHDKWIRLFSEDLKPSEILKKKEANLGCTIYKGERENHIYLELKFPKNEDPSKINLYVSFESAYFGHSSPYNFDGNLVAKVGLGNSEHPDNVYTASTYLSSSHSWEDVTSTLYLKRRGSVITWLSEDPYYGVVNSFFSCSTEIPLLTNNVTNKNIVAEPFYFYLDPLRNNYFAVKTNDINKGDYAYSASVSNREELPIDGKTYYPLSFHKLFASEDGNLIPIYENESDYFSDNKSDEENNRIRYVCSTLQPGFDTGLSKDLFKICFLPLPDKVYPNKKYVVKIRKGARIYQDDWLNINDYNTRSAKLEIPVLSKEDYTIEEY